MATRGAFGFRVGGRTYVSFTPTDGGRSLMEYMDGVLFRVFRKITPHQAFKNVKGLVPSNRPNFMTPEEFIEPTLLGRNRVYTPVSLRGRGYGWLHVIDFDSGVFSSDEGGGGHRDVPLSHYLPRNLPWERVPKEVPEKDSEKALSSPALPEKKGNLEVVIEKKVRQALLRGRR